MNDELDLSQYLVSQKPSSKEESVDFSKYKIKEKPSRLRSIISAPIKGALKGGAEIVDLLPIPKPIPTEFGVKLTEELLPTQQELPEKILERAGKLAPGAAFGGGGLIRSAIQSLIGGTAGQVAEEMGGGELSQTLAEMIGLSFPGFSKTISATKSQKPLVEFARKMGLTESEIAPLLPEGKKASILAKFTAKKPVQESLKKSKQSISGIYKRLNDIPEANAILPESNVRDLMVGLKDGLKQMPQSVRKKIMPDIMDMFKGDVTAKSLMNLDHDINFYTGKGLSQIGILRNPVMKAIEAASPELAEQYKFTNELWKRRAELGKKLKPGIFDDIKSFGRMGSIAAGIFTHNYNPLYIALGEMASGPMVSKFLTSPRLQNLSQQFLKSVNESKIAQAQKIGKVLEDEIDRRLVKKPLTKESESQGQ